MTPLKPNVDHFGIGEFYMNTKLKLLEILDSS